MIEVWRAWVLGHGKPGHSQCFDFGFIDHRDLAQHFAAKLHTDLWETWPVIVCVQQRIFRSADRRSWGKVEIVQVRRVLVPEFRADRKRPWCSRLGCVRVPTHNGHLCKFHWRTWILDKLASRL